LLLFSIIVLTLIAYNCNINQQLTSTIIIIIHQLTLSINITLSRLDVFLSAIFIVESFIFLTIFDLKIFLSNSLTKAKSPGAISARASFHPMSCDLFMQKE
jgi:hypothetical protein